MPKVLEWKAFNNEWRNNDPTRGLARWLRILTWPIRHPHKTVVAIEPWGVLFAVIGLFLSLHTLQVERLEHADNREYRDEEKEHRDYLLDLAKNNRLSWAYEKIEKYKTGAYPVGIKDAIQYFVSIHSKFPDEISFQDANFPDANFADADFSGINFRNANLSEADMRGAFLMLTNFNGATLEDVDLTGATLMATSLNRTNLAGADLRETFINEADFENADLTQASLKGAKIRVAYFAGAKLHFADLTDADHFIGETGYWDASLCKTTMPDGSICNRDCEQIIEEDRSCSFYD